MKGYDQAMRYLIPYVFDKPNPKSKPNLKKMLKMCKVVEVWKLSIF